MVFNSFSTIGSESLESLESDKLFNSGPMYNNNNKTLLYFHHTNSVAPNWASGVGGGTVCAPKA